MANRANGPMIRHQQWSTFNRNISYQQRRSREIAQISQNNIRRNQTDQQRLTQSNYHVSCDGQIVYSEDDQHLLSALKCGLASSGVTVNLIYLLLRILTYNSRHYVKGEFNFINRLSLVFYIPLILLNAARILDFTRSLRQRLVEVLHPIDGAGDGHKD